MVKPKNCDKPTTLETVLALSPIPVLGEKAAMKVAKHIAEADREFYDNSPLPYSETQHQENVYRRFFAARSLGYALPVGLTVGAWLLYQAI